MRRAETVVVRATPPGPGALAVVYVVGPGAARRVRSAGLRLSAAPSWSPVLDGLVARDVPAPDWGLPTVEISTHGGDAAPAALVSRLGLREAPLSEVLDLAVRLRRLDRIRAEARLLLPGAASPDAAAFLLAQWGGALGRAVSRLSRASARRLLAAAPRAFALVEPPRVVLSGRPNAGKSSLFNALLGRDRALVDPAAGTTRDPVEALLPIGGAAVRLVDTAGEAEFAEGPDREAVARARESAGEADLVVRVRDGRRPDPSPAAVRVATHQDLPGATRAPGEIGVALPGGRGVEAVRRAIGRALGLGPVRGAAAFTLRQAELLASGLPLAELRRSLLWT